MIRAAVAFALVLLVALPATAGEGIALLPLEPLGLDAERALRLEALFRAELERLAGRPLPARDALERDPALVTCSGEPACLAAAGRRLGVSEVVAGNIGELGESYVVNLKLIDVEHAVEVRRVSERLRGRPDELIEAVRVAAHRLLRPDEVRGALAVLSDVPATVTVDGRPAGRTPLARPLGGLTVGTHAILVEAPGHAPFATSVEVHFQKTSEVVVRLDPSGPGLPAEPSRRSLLASPWTWVAAGAAAIVVGVLVGRAFADDDVVDCRGMPGRCP